jgi:ubiquinone/menaquinone biosynthesis C-methylase UbiE
MSLTAAPDHIAYLDIAARTAIGQDYKRHLASALDLRPGQAVLDLGCGPGTDLARMADAVTDTGKVIGVDGDPEMVAEATRRLAGRPNVEVRAGDAHELPLEGGSVDTARADRVVQHVADPIRVLAEVRRVLRPGGLFGTAEPDWDTLTVADSDEETNRGFARFTAGRVRNATIGRHLPRLAVAGGFRVRSIDAVPVVFHDFGTADMILGLTRNAYRAVEEGTLTQAAVEPWLARLVSAPLVASFTFYIVVAERA